MALKVSYPLTCITTGGKMVFCYGLQEALRIEHNLEGDRYRTAKADYDDKKIDQATYDAANVRWETYKVTYFANSEEAIILGIMEWRATAKGQPFWSNNLTTSLVEK